MAENPIIVAVSVPVNDWELRPTISLSALKKSLLDAANNAKNMDLVLLPMNVVGEDDTEAEKKLSFFERFASEHSSYLVYNQEKDNTCISVILDRKGHKVGEYIKTHAIEGIDSQQILGDKMPVFCLDFAKVALLIGTDIYFPELAETYSLAGAELMLCSMGTQPLRDDTMYQRLLRGRALEMYMFVAAACYASDSNMYMTNNYEYVRKEGAQTGSGYDINANGLGKHPGRAVIYDLRGEQLACSGREAGCAVAKLRMEQKRNSAEYFLIPHLLKKQNLRGTFDTITGSYPYIVREYPRKKAKITFVHLPYQGSIGSWVPSPEDVFDWEKISDTVWRAAEESDLVVLSELSSPTHVLTEQMERFYKKAAKEKNCYILANHELEIDCRRNISILYGRDGNEIFRYEKINGLQYIYDDIETIGFELPVAELDFATIGVVVCADCYSPEIARILSLKGAELLLIQTQSWGPDSQSVNEGRYRAWAIENGVIIAVAEFANSQVGNRSCVIDTTGETVFASAYDSPGIYTYVMELEKQINVPSFKYEENTVVCSRDFKKRLRAARRPELYHALTAQGIGKLSG